MKLMKGCAIILFFAVTVLAFGEPPQSSAKKLDESIQEVISKREYQWRLPRQAPPEEKENFLIRFLESWANTFNRFWKPVGKWIAKIYDWLRRALLSLNPSSSGGGALTKNALDRWIIGLIVLLTAILLYFIWKVRKKRKHGKAVLEATPIQPIPDLADENVIADQLPQEGWLKLAEDLLSRGDLRLAMRAYFMATLANLAESRWITVAKFKSNRDYWVELQRRAHEKKELQDAFYNNVKTVDSVWYGMHPVTMEMLHKFRENAETVKQGVA